MSHWNNFKSARKLIRVAHVLASADEHSVEDIDSFAQQAGLDYFGLTDVLEQLMQLNINRCTELNNSGLVSKFQLHPALSGNELSREVLRRIREADTLCDLQDKLARKSSVIAQIKAALN